MELLKCKMCGGDLEVEAGSSVGTCQYCGSQQTICPTTDDVTINLFNRANNFRRKNQFDKAQATYEKILDIRDANAEAHWCVVLCKYGVEYVKDPKTSKNIPTCHRTQYDSIFSDVDYLATLEYADTEQRTLYEKEAQIISELQKNTLTIVHNESPFDVFICYKETDENNMRTRDSVITQQIYDQLTQDGLKVFYAAITLEDKLGQEYEPYIFAALHSARVMLVVGTKPEYFQAAWVRNEWARYLSIMHDEPDRTLIPCYRDMDAYDLPEEFAHLQAQDMSKIGFINDLFRGIRKLIPKEGAEAAKAGSSAGVDSLLRRAFLCLEDSSWEKADELLEKTLNKEPECSRAYVGKLLIALEIPLYDELDHCGRSYIKHPMYLKAIRYASKQENNELTAMCKRNEEKIAIYIREHLQIAESELAAGHWETAVSEYTSVLNRDTYCVDANIGMLLATSQLKDEATLACCGKLFNKSNYYLNAINGAKENDPDHAERLRKICANNDAYTAAINKQQMLRRDFDTLGKGEADYQITNLTDKLNECTYHVKNMEDNLKEADSNLRIGHSCEVKPHIADMIVIVIKLLAIVCIFVWLYSCLTDGNEITEKQGSTAAGTFVVGMIINLIILSREFDNLILGIIGGIVLACPVIGDAVIMLICLINLLRGKMRVKPLIAAQKQSKQLLDDAKKALEATQTDLETAKQDYSKSLSEKQNQLQDQLTDIDSTINQLLGSTF